MTGKFSKKQSNVYISNWVAYFKMCSRTCGTFNLRPVVHAEGIQHLIILYYTLPHGRKYEYIPSVRCNSTKEIFMHILQKIKSLRLHNLHFPGRIC